MASSVLLAFLMATLAVFSVAASAYSSSGEQQMPLTSTSTSMPNDKKVPKFEEILGRDICHGAQEALIYARDKCCNDLGKRGKCICPAVRRVVDSITFLQGLCGDYNACSGSWNDEADVVDDARENECKLLVDKENKAGECNEAVEHLKEMHEHCFHILAFPGGF